MQATARATESGFDRLKLALIAVGLLVTTLAGVTAWQLRQDSYTTATSVATHRQAVHHPSDRPFTRTSSALAITMQQFFAAKEVRQDTLDLAAGALATSVTQPDALQRFLAHKEASMDAELVVLAAQPTRAQRVAATKEARLAAEDLRSELAARAARHESMQRLYAYKEEQLFALTSPVAAASATQVSHGLDHADTIALLRAATRNWPSRMLPRRDAHAAVWTLLDDLTPVRVWP